jgi:hypothetical protein
MPGGWVEELSSKTPLTTGAEEAVWKKEPSYTARGNAS